VQSVLHIAGLHSIAPIFVATWLPYHHPTNIHQSGPVHLRIITTMARRLLSRSLLSRMLDSSAASSLVNVQAALVAVESSSASCSLFRQCRIHWSQPQTIQVAAYAKQAKGKGKGKGAAAQAAEQDDQPAIEFSLDEPTQAMETTLERFQHELAGVRTGRANPGLIDTLVVDVHGDRMPLKACGTVTVRGSQTLAVAVYDPSMVPDVIKAIKNSPLGLNPQQESGEILVKVPKMSKDTIEKMVKLVHMEAETAKVGTCMWCSTDAT
jgi:hypothetical protein